MSPQIGKHRFLHTVNQAVCGAVHNLELANLGAHAQFAVRKPHYLLQNIYNR